MKRQRKNTLAFFLCVCVFILNSKQTLAANVDQEKSDYSVSQAEKIIQKALDLSLYKHPQWLRLLHIPIQQANKKNQKSQINSATFFLIHKNHTKDFAKKELVKTLEQFLLISDFKKLMFSEKTSAICRYPARYAWLKEQLGFNLEDAFSQCESFLEWSSLKKLDSVSLLLVSGYLGNPASTFGHSLIKFNTANNSLLDVAVNFGALAPVDEPIPVYIAKGVAGGYQARFSEQRYFAEEINYSDLEQRDMWEYKLNLTDYQKQLLTGHIWELLGQKFTYYFFEENCAYRVAELLELTYEEKFLPNWQQWYAPISVFHTLSQNNLNQLRVMETIYHPSPQRELYLEFNKLPKSSKKQFNRFIENGKLTFSQSKNIQQQNELLEIALKYNTYKLIAAKKKNQQSILDQRKLLLQKRLALPATNTASVKNTLNKDSPAMGSTPSRIQASYIHSQKLGSVQRLAASPFYYDELSNHAQDGSELIVMNLELDRYLNDHNDSLRLSSIELLNIQKIDLDTPAMHGEKNYSWRLSTKFVNNDLNCEDCFDFNFLAGIGKAKRFKSYFGYGLMNLNYINNEFNVVPTLTLDKVNTYQGFSTSIGYNYALESSDKNFAFSMKYLYRLSQNMEISVEYLDQANEAIDFSFASYF